MRLPSQSWLHGSQVRYPLGSACQTQTTYPLCPSRTRRRRQARVACSGVTIGTWRSLEAVILPRTRTMRSPLMGSKSDLVARLKADAPLNTPDPRTFYGGGARGYTDYPRLDGATTAAT
jgi:hypothetical protein